MMTLTHEAVDAIEALLDGSDLPDGAGLRIAAGVPTDDGWLGGLTISLADAPGAEDRVIEEGEARVFLDSRSAVALEGQLLDARKDDDAVVFEIREPDEG